MKTQPASPKKDHLSLERKIRTYSMAAVAAMAAQPAAGAIIYTDITPDVTFVGAFTPASYLLDLNNDGTPDFTLRHIVIMNKHSTRINPVIGNQVLGSGSNSSFYPFALEAGMPINVNEATWQGWLTGTSIGSGFMAYVDPSSAYGNWLGVSDKYLGLRFQVGGNWHYGWARLDIDTACSMIVIKDYAYESDPNIGLLAGEMGSGSGLNDLSLSRSVHLTVSDRVLSVNIKDAVLSNAALTVTSVNGQEVFSAPVTGGLEQFGVSHLRSGIYLVSIRSKEGILTRRIYME